MRKTIFVLTLGFLLWPAATSAQWSGTGAPTTSDQTVSSPDTPAGTLSVSGDATKQFPLKHTDVKAVINGSVAEVEVQQSYINPYTVPIEAVYVFPLPNNAAVYDMEMRVGKRIIKSEIKKRDEAQQIYQQAKDAGKRAALLDQERPNIFTQSVANILPGDEITILIRYEEQLVFDKSTYQFVFPMVVGPRYIPGDWVENNFVSGVTDWSRITPPVLEPGVRSGHDISLSVAINTNGIPITQLASVTHQIDTTQLSPGAAAVAIKPNDTVPNKDFVLTYELGSQQPQFAFFTHQPSIGAGYFSLMIQPQTSFTDSQVTPKEIFFIVDTSGSMTGEPMAKSKDTMVNALKHLNPEDSFNIISFSNITSRLSSEPLPNTPDNIIKGLQYIRGIQEGGGTEMLPSVLEALQYPHDPKKLRIVTMMSDGYIGNEDEILSAIQNKLGDQSRLFSFGIGSSTNRYLLDNMGRIGRGSAYYVTLRDDSAKIVDEFYRRVESPLLTDLQIDWGGLQVTELYPDLVPDIFAGQPLFVYGRYQGTADTEIKITGRAAIIEEGTGSALRKLFGGSASVQRTEQLFTIPVTLTAVDNRDWVGRLWARAKITSLTDELTKPINSYSYYGTTTAKEDPALVAQITSLGLEHRLSTKYTSFVAVEETAVADPGTTVTVPVPLPLPEGTVYEGFFGPATDTRAKTSGNAASAPAGTATTYSIESIGAQIGLGSSDLRYSLMSALMSGAVILVWPAACLIIAAVYRIVRRKDSRRKSFGRVLGRCLQWSSLSIVIVGATVAWITDQYNEVRPVINYAVQVYLPLVIMGYLIFRGFLKWTSWRRVLLFSLAMIGLAAAFKIYTLVTALGGAIEVFTAAPLVYKLLMFAPVLIFLVYLVVWLAVFRRQRWGLYVGLIIAGFGIIFALIHGVRSLSSVGWQSFFVTMLLGSIYVLFVRPPVAPQSKTLPPIPIP